MPESEKEYHLCRIYPVSSSPFFHTMMLHGYLMQICAEDPDLPDHISSAGMQGYEAFFLSQVHIPGIAKVRVQSSIKVTTPENKNSTERSI
jgi:hypothetical protein